MSESLRICNSILSLRQQGEIEYAATLAAQGFEGLAERHRMFAGYDQLKYRPDADKRPIR